jgi:hypothetical protein
MEDSPKKNTSRYGRNPKANPKKYVHGFTLNENENTQFLSLVKDSGAKNKIPCTSQSHFLFENTNSLCHFYLYLYRKIL